MVYVHSQNKNKLFSLLVMIVELLPFVFQQFFSTLLARQLVSTKVLHFLAVYVFHVLPPQIQPIYKI